MSAVLMTTTAMEPPRWCRLAFCHVHAYFAQMVARMLMPKSVSKRFEREGSIDHRLESQDIDCSDHILLLTPVTNNEPLQPDLLNH